MDFIFVLLVPAAVAAVFVLFVFLCGRVVGDMLDILGLRNANPYDPEAS